MGREIRFVSEQWVHPVDKDNEPKPLIEDEMPQWAEEEKTHIMMYENCSEGTPISPAFKRDEKEKLARWLVDNKASWFGGYTADYETWLDVCNRGHGGGMVLRFVNDK